MLWRGSCLCLSLLAGMACRSMPFRENLSAEDAALIRADSEVFAAIVLPKPEPGVEVSQYNQASLLVDSRPYGVAVGFHDVAGGSTGLRSSELFPIPDSAMMRRLTGSRKKLLAAIGLKEGGAFSYPKCGGTLAPPPPPGSARPTSTCASGPRDGCPAAAETYINVGVPVRGIQESFTKPRFPGSKTLNLTGDLWTVVVNNHFATRGG